MHHNEPLLGWRVLLLGGHSGVGKTLVAQRLAQHYGVALAEVDDFRLVMQRTIPVEQQPLLYFFVDMEDVLQWPGPVLCERLIAVNQRVCAALEIVVANHVATSTPMILEGDGIVPAFAAQRVQANLDVEGQVRAVFIVEQDATRIHEAMLQRDRGFRALAQAERDRWVELSWYYGQWLTREAARVGLPVVDAQPWATLASRVLAVIGM